MTSILKISQGSVLALNAVRLLATSAGKPMTTKGAAGAMAVSEAHLSKMLQRLGKAGIVSAVRGPNGGYLLAREISELRLLDIWEAIEGPLDHGPCRVGLPECRRGGCVVAGFFDALGSEVLRHFEKRLSEI